MYINNEIDRKKSKMNAPVFYENFFLLLQLLRIIYVLCLCNYTWAELCGGNGESLKYLRGDALTDNLDCIGPNGKPYPE